MRENESGRDINLDDATNAIKIVRFKGCYVTRFSSIDSFFSFLKKYRAIHKKILIITDILFHTK